MRGVEGVRRNLVSWRRWRRDDEWGVSCRRGVAPGGSGLVKAEDVVVVVVVLCALPRRPPSPPPPPSKEPRRRISDRIRCASGDLATASFRSGDRTQARVAAFRSSDIVMTRFLAEQDDDEDERGRGDSICEASAVEIVAVAVTASCSPPCCRLAGTESSRVDDA